MGSRNRAMWHSRPRLCLIVWHSGPPLCGSEGRNQKTQPRAAVAHSQSSQRRAAVPHGWTPVHGHFIRLKCHPWRSFTGVHWRVCAVGPGSRGSRPPGRPRPRRHHPPRPRRLRVTLRLRRKKVAPGQSLLQKSRISRGGSPPYGRKQRRSREEESGQNHEERTHDFATHHSAYSCLSSWGSWGYPTLSSATSAPSA